MNWRQRLAQGVTAKDMMLHMIGRFGMNGGRYQAVEFCGEAVTALSMQERMTLSNMSAELGAQVGLIAPDSVTADYLRAAGVPDDIDLGRWHRRSASGGRDARFRRRAARAAGGRAAQPGEHA